MSSKIMELTIIFSNFLCICLSICCAIIFSNFSDYFPIYYTMRCAFLNNPLKLEWEGSWTPNLVQKDVKLILDKAFVNISDG